MCDGYMINLINAEWICWWRSVMIYNKDNLWYMCRTITGAEIKWVERSCFFHLRICANVRGLIWVIYVHSRSGFSMSPELVINQKACGDFCVVTRPSWSSGEHPNMPWHVTMLLCSSEKHDVSLKAIAAACCCRCSCPNLLWLVVIVPTQGRLLEHSRSAGILEGKIIASTEENKARPSRAVNRCPLGVHFFGISCSSGSSVDGFVCFCWCFLSCWTSEQVFRGIGGATHSKSQLTNISHDTRTTYKNMNTAFMTNAHVVLFSKLL